MRLVRPALAVAAVLAVGMATSATGATAGPTTLTFADPAGDNTSPSAASDITGVTFTTTGSKVGKKYVPKALVITLALSAPPSDDGTTIYEVEFDQPGCGSVYVSVVPGSPVLDPSFNFADCGSEPDETGSTGTAFDAVPEVKGSSLVWTISMKSLRMRSSASSSITRAPLAPPAKRHRS